MKLGKMTLGIMALGILALGIMPLGIMPLGISNSEQNDTHCNVMTQHAITLFQCYVDRSYAERYGSSKIDRFNYDGKFRHNGRAY
jgi:hypothetical protein